MRIFVVLVLLAGCVTLFPPDVPLVAREPFPCDADPAAPRSVLPSHPALEDAASPARLREVMGEGRVREMDLQGGVALVWTATRDLGGLNEAQARFLVRDALDALGIDETLELTAWRTARGVSVVGTQAWRDLRLQAVSFDGLDGSRYNESRLVVGPVFDFAPAERMPVSQARAERVADRFLACAREAQGAPPAEVAHSALVVLDSTLVWRVSEDAAGSSCSWFDVAYVDAFTGAVVSFTQSCMT